MHSAFFEPSGPGEFYATPATAGPWSAHSQHGGPPSALAARELERHAADPGQRLARVTIDILRPVPLGLLSLRTTMVRPGRKVSLLETVLQAGGQEVLHARGWRIAVPGAGVPAISPEQPQLPAVPADASMPAFRRAHTEGYLAAVDWRFVSGGLDDYGPGASAWLRPRIPLVAGEDATPMSRTLLLADSGSGVGSVLDPEKFLCINVDLTVVLTRDPEGDWLLLEAGTTVSERGSGMTQTQLSDQSGRCGTAVQTLLAEPR
ncbi:MAG TPA: thioesterase family protein [Streptosporangiaceae bacterium]